MYYLGIDCGTQGTKAVVYDAGKGVVISKGYAPHQMIVGENGEREQDARWWIDALVKSVREAISKSGISGGKIEGIGVSGQQHGLVLLDEEGRLLRLVKLWNDTSTAGENEEIVGSLGSMKGVLKAIGSTLPVGYTASKVRYVANREEKLYSRVRHVLLPHDYINYYLTGEYFTDSSEASGTGYYDVGSGSYSRKMMDLIDPSGILQSAVPPIVSWRDVPGRLRKDVASLLGLREGIIVSPGGGDNTMGAIGTRGMEKGNSTMSLGTSGTVCMAASNAKDEVDELLQVYNVLDGFLVTCCTLNATSASRSVQELFGLDIKTFDSLMAKSPIGSDGVIAAQFYSGERMPPLPHSKGFFKNITTENLRMENIIRSVAEAVVYTLRWGYEKMTRCFGYPERLIITGGGANSAPWRRIASDVMNLPLYSLASDEGGALGGALQAEFLVENTLGGNVPLDEITAKAIKFDESKYIEPIEENHKRYMECYSDWLDAIEKEWGISMRKA